MVPQIAGQIHDVLHDLRRCVSTASSPGVFLKQARRALIDRLQLKFAFTAMGRIDQAVECHSDLWVDLREGKPSTIQAEPGMPVCAVELLSGRLTGFEGPDSVCVDCPFANPCRGCTTLAAPIYIGEEMAGVLGLGILESSSLDVAVVQLLHSHVSAMFHLLNVEHKKRETEEALLEAHRQIELALNGGTQGLWDWDMARDELTFDGHWRYLLQLGDEDTKSQWGSNPWKRFMIEEEDPAVYDAKYSNPNDEPAFYESEHQVRTRTNPLRWVLIKGSVTERSEMGEPLRASGTISDITSRKLNEQEKGKLAEQIRQIQKMESIGRLAGGIAHDLNNLLSPVIGYTEMALYELHPEDTLYEDISQVRDAAERAKDLTQQLLAFSRKQVLDMQALNVNTIVSKSENIVRRLIREDIEIAYRLESMLSTVKADPSQIQQIVLNLATNAADAMPNGGKMIVETQNVVIDDTYVSFHPEAEKGEYVLLSVSDTGFGMSKETLECIFDPFFTTKKKGRGTGLGLSTVYGIVKQHGGYIWAYSEPKVGSTLKVYLPVIQEEAAPPRISSYSPDDTSGSETILVVEDEAAVRRLVCKILSKQGYEIIEAVSVTHALEIAKAQNASIDLLLTDVVMPGMNGKELYDRLAPFCPDLRVLYVSGYTDDVIAHHGVLDDGVRFVQKPFSVESLTTKIRKALDD